MQMDGGYFKLRVPVPEGNCTLRVRVQDRDGEIVGREECRYVRVMDEQVCVCVCLCVCVCVWQDRDGEIVGREDHRYVRVMDRCDG